MSKKKKHMGLRFYQCGAVSEYSRRRRCGKLDTGERYSGIRKNTGRTAGRAKRAMRRRSPKSRNSWIPCSPI